MERKTKKASEVLLGLTEQKVTEHKKQTDEPPLHTARVPSEPRWPRRQIIKVLWNRRGRGKGRKTKKQTTTTT